MNFLSNLVKNLLEVIIEEKKKRVKEEKEEEKEIIKQEVKREAEKKVEEIKVSPLIQRVVPKVEISEAAPKPPTREIKEYLEKISAKELKPGPEKEKMLESLKEFKPSEELLKKGFLPSLEIITEKKEEKEKIEFRFDWKKLNEFVNLPNLNTIQCMEGEPIIISYKDGRVESKDIKPNREELIALINEISKQTKIPVVPEFSVYFQDFFIQAWINRKIKLVLKKII